MTHFPLVQYEEVNDPKVKEVYDQILAELGFGIIPNLFKSMASLICAPLAGLTELGANKNVSNAS